MERVMNLREFIDDLEKLIADQPQVETLQVIYSEDDEGNGFREVTYAPSFGRFEYGEFRVEDGEFRDEYDDTTDLNPHFDARDNAICIN